MTYETLKSIFENSYPGKKEIFEKLVSPIFNKAKDLTSSDRDFSTEVDSSKIKSCTIFAQVGGAFPITFADVELKENVSVKTNRVAIQNCVRRILDNNTNAIIFFHQPESTEWRVSYVHRGASNKDSTNAKRYTYLCGKNHACRTVSERFLELTNVTRINDEIMLKAFSVATLSDEFFDEYKVFYEDFVQFITGNRYLKKVGKNKWEKIKIHEPNKDIFPQFIKIAQKELNSADEEIIISLAQKLVRDYIKKLMGRLVFLQFLQKRGWLGVPKNENWGEGDKNYIQNLFSNSEYKDDFLDKVLETLFFDTLNTKRDNDICESILGNEIKIPYLNGGLFEKDMIFDSTNIKFPKEFFSNPDKKEVERKFAGEIEDYPYTEYSGILDFFGKFNFTIDETDPYDQEIGVDPEMLGKIFENLLEDNKDKGAFYTPKEIVQYMCRESLIAYLLTDSQIEGDKIRDFVRNHTDNFLDEEKAEIKEKLENVKICDPAVGSGAFPMGMLNELYACRHIIENDLQPAKIKEEIVKNNIYGVDIEKGAVDIARLRFWLAIIVDEDEPKPLPNLDYKIMQGNSLLECFEGIDLSNLLKKEELSGKGTDLFGKYIDSEDAVKELKNAKIDSFDFEIKRYFDIDNHDEKKKSQESILEIVKNQIVDLLELKIKKERMESQSLETTIQSLRDKIKFLSKTPNDPEYKKIQKELEKKEAEHKKLFEVISYIESKQEEIEKLSHENNQFFLWHTWFNDVFNRPNNCNGGFDIIIGNPPYIEAKKLKYISNVLKNWYKVYSGTADLSIYFIEHGLKLLNEHGILSFITTNKFLNTEYGKPVRKYIADKHIHQLINFEQVEVFEDILVSSVILIIQNNKAEIDNNFVFQQFYKMKSVEFKENFVYLYENFGNYPQKVLDDKEWSFSSTEELMLKQKIEKEKVIIKNLKGVYVYRGVTTGYNPAFIISNEQRKYLLLQDSKNSDIIKNMLQGRNIRKWYYNESDENLLQTGFDTDIQHLYPQIYKHLLDFKTQLEVRSDQGKNWYNLRACKYYNDFEKKEKIIWGLTADKWAFALDEKQHYLPSNAYMLTSEKIPIRFLLGLLNSKLLKHYFKYIGIMTAGGAYTLKAATIEALPMPEYSQKTDFKVIELVDQILAAKKDNPQADTSDLEHQIDLFVYQLYDLTFEEAKIIDVNLTEEEFTYSRKLLG